jgi:hypothetical protein
MKRHPLLVPFSHDHHHARCSSKHSLNTSACTRRRRTFTSCSRRAGTPHPSCASSGDYSSRMSYGGATTVSANRTASQ